MMKKVLAKTYIWIMLLFMYLPVLVLIAYSFSSATYIGEPYGDPSFDLYVGLFHSEKILTALGNTVLIALISAAVSTVLGTLGAIGAFYSKKRNRKLIDTITQIPIVNAEIVMALSLTIMFVFLGNVVFRGANLFSFWTLLIGHVVLGVPFVYISVKPKLQQMDPSLYEAAVDLGATPRQALNKVIIPEILPGIFSGFLLSITLSLDDFIITAFTRGTGLLNGENQIETLSTYIQSVIKRRPVPPEMRALTAIIFFIVVIVVIAITIKQRKQSMGNSTIKIRRARYNEKK